MRIKPILFIILLSLVSNTRVKAQELIVNKEHTLAFKTQFFQIKDEFNYGLVFNGLNLVIGYEYSKTTAKGVFSYSPELGFGPSFKKGIGLLWYFKPIDVFYGFNLNKSKEKLFVLGAYFSTNYKWQIYPYLQSGHFFWFSSLEIGPKASYQFAIKDKHFKVNFSNSVLGWNSRPTPATETYFYSFKLSDFYTEAHSNLSFGSYNLFNHTQFGIELLRPNKNMNFGYEFEYYGYYENPTLSYVNHSLNLKWKLGKPKKSTK